MGIMYLVATLKRAGIAAQVVDEGLGDEVPEGDIYVTATATQKQRAMELGGGRYSAIGGPLATTDESVSAAFSLCVCGEGEQSIVDIVKRKPTGTLRLPRIRDLDSIPFPDRATAWRYSYTIAGKKAAAMITSRGCTGRCSFCCRAVFGGGTYLKSSGNVLDEARDLKALGFGSIQFYDDSVAISKRRLLEISEGLGRLGMLWRCMLRSDQVSQDLLKAMAAGGCVEAIFGIESGSQRVLDNIRKHETVSQQRDAVLWTKAAGIRVKESVIIGLPGEDWESVAETAKFVRETSPDFLDAIILSVYKGSDICSNPSKYDVKFDEGGWFKGNEEPRSRVCTSRMTAKEIENARKTILEEFAKSRG